MKQKPHPERGRVPAPEGPETMNGRGKNRNDWFQGSAIPKYYEKRRLGPSHYRGGRRLIQDLQSGRRGPREIPAFKGRELVSGPFFHVGELADNLDTPYKGRSKKNEGLSWRGKKRNRCLNG